jgi:hypothetical protein
MQLARANSLDFYWTTGHDLDQVTAYIGRKIAIIGVENDVTKRLAIADIEILIRDVPATLSRAGIQGTCGLHLDFLPD